MQGLQNEGPAFHAALERLTNMVGEIGRLEGQVNDNQQARADIAADQERIRANLESVGPNTDLGRRYVDKLNAQESRLAELDKSDQKLKETIEARRKAVADVVAGLTL